MQLLKRWQPSLEALRSELAVLVRQRATAKTVTPSKDHGLREQAPEDLILDLAKRGKNREALKLVDDVLSEPSGDWNLVVRSLCPIAIVIAQEVGDVQLVKHYCEILLASDPENALALYQMADSLDMEGRIPDARQYATKAYELSTSRDDVYSKGIVELIVKRFPSITSGSG
jgi:tetratricopeptide (TPR) repeat protein